MSKQTRNEGEQLLNFDQYADGFDLTDARPLAYVVADDAQRGDLARRALESDGRRVGRSYTVSSAAASLQRLTACVVVAELGAEDTTDEDALLARLTADAHDHSLPAIVCFPRDALDRVVARVDAPHATLLCDPTLAERTAAVALAQPRPLVMMNEREGLAEAVRLQSLADEVSRIARALSGLVADGGGEPRRETVSDGLIGYRAEPARAPRGEPETVRAEDIRTIIRLRRQRDAVFGGELFADPAWDMMLDLLAARIERLRVAVSSLCIAAAVPPTTALRWIKTLTDMGLFKRVADPTDGRRVFIELSDTAARAMLNFIGESKRARAGLV